MMIFRIQGINRFDRAIFILLVSLLFGGLGGYLTPCRIVTIFYVPLLLKCFNCKQLHVKNITYCFFVFYLYCAVSFLWTPDKVQGAKELIYYPIHILYFLEIVVFSKLSANPLKSIALGWTINILLSSLLGLYEIITDVHFSIGVDQQSDRIMNFGHIQVLQRFARVFYANYNTFNTVITFALPFITYYILKYPSNKCLRRIAAITYFLSTIIVITNGSRGGILSIILITASVIMLTKSSREKNIMVFTLCVMFMFIFYYFYTEIFTIIEMRISEGNIYEDDTRSNLIKLGIQICIDSVGFGSGVGSVQAKLGLLNKGGITITHNMFIELLSQYGILFTVIFMLFILKLFKRIRYIIDQNRRAILYSSFVSMPFYMVIDSGYLLYPQLYALFASLYIYCTHNPRSVDYTSKETITSIHLNT